MDTIILKDCPWCGQWTRFALRGDTYVCRSCDRSVEEHVSDPEVALVNNAGVSVVGAVVEFPKKGGKPKPKKSPNDDKPKHTTKK